MPADRGDFQTLRLLPRELAILCTGLARRSVGLATRVLQATVEDAVEAFSYADDICLLLYTSAAFGASAGGHERIAKATCLRFHHGETTIVPSALNLVASRVLSNEWRSSFASCPIHGVACN